MASEVLITFWVVSTFLIFLAYLIRKTFKSYPLYFNELFVYGKVKNSKKSKSFVKFIDVPKRWFQWFYLLGIICNGTTSYIVFNAYVEGLDPPFWYKFLLSVVQNNLIEPQTSAFSALLAIFLMFLQDVRRFFECVFISSYSKSTMNIIHFSLGVILYSTFNLVVLSEAPLLAKQGNLHEALFEIRIIFGIVLFVLGSALQHYSHRLFANLRRDKAGKHLATSHVLPQGGPFEYISNPHYLGEIIIYTGFILILSFNHLAGLSIWIFVFTNQIIAGLLNHNWYQEKFKNFPSKRKAIFPFVI